MKGYNLTYYNIAVMLQYQDSNTQHQAYARDRKRRRNTIARKQNEA